MLVLLPLLLATAVQDVEQLPVLKVGEAIEGEITDENPEVHTPTLDADYTQAPTVGKTYRIRVEESGPYYIDLRSYDFDAYLVLRDAKSELLAEHYDSFLNVHSRLGAELVVGRDYLVSGCALHGASGRFELRLEKRSRYTNARSPYAKPYLAQCTRILARTYTASQ